MILNQLGQTFLNEDEKRTFYVGQEIVANAQSIYAGLPGIITEIRDGDDKDTENTTPDIYCMFSIPVPENPLFVERLEGRFGENVRDICMEDIIMSPYMLEPKMGFQINPATTEMLILSYFVDCSEDNNDYILCVSDDRDILLERLEAHAIANLRIPKGASLDTSKETENVYRAVYQSNDVYICYSIFPAESQFSSDRRDKTHAA